MCVSSVVRCTYKLNENNNTTVISCALYGYYSLICGYIDVYMPELLL